MAIRRRSWEGAKTHDLADSMLPARAAEVGAPPQPAVVDRGGGCLQMHSPVLRPLLPAGRPHSVFLLQPTNPVDQFGGRKPRHQGQEGDPAAIRLDDCLFGDRPAVGRGVFRPLAMHVGLKLLQDADRRQIAKNQDVIDTLQGSHDLGPRQFGQDRAAAPSAAAPRHRC